MTLRTKAVVGIAAAGVLLGGSVLVAPATAQLTHMSAGQAITLDCPVQPNIRPVSGLSITVECPAPSPSASPVTSSGPTPTPTATAVPPTPTPIAASPSPTSTPNPTPTPAVGTAGWGSAINADTKANLRLDGNRVAHRFRASTTSTVMSVRWQERGGSGYSLGTCGKVRVSLQADTPSGPSGTVIGTAGTFGPKCPSGGIFDATTLSGAVVKGQLYDIVFENTDPNPASNYLSVNETFIYTGISPRQLRFPDADYAVLYGTSSWSVQSKYTADMDVSYADGTHDGDAYIGMIGINGQAVYAATISGSSQVRETIPTTPPAGVSSASVRIRRTSGSDPLTISLITSSGAVVGQGQVPASMVPATASGGDNGGSTWVTVNFPTASFAGGELRLTTAASSTWTAAPIREGTDVGFATSLGFAGAAQVSTNNGGSWSPMYSDNVLDLQFAIR